MPKDLKAFQIRVNGRILDYRLGQELDLDQIKTFFEKKFQVRKLFSGGRNVLGILERGSRVFFLKLATTKGISELTKNEYRWNEEFNSLVSRQTSNFWVPQNEECGLYNDKLFYLITDKFDGELLIRRPTKSEVSKNIRNLLPLIIKFSELIQTLDISKGTRLE